MLSSNRTVLYSRYLLVVLSALFLSGCGTSPREHTAPSAELYSRAEVFGFQDIRYWGDEPTPYLDDAIEKLKDAFAGNPALREHIDILALSGGAEDGAYGVGFLKGWTERGDRPEFLMVTGISTGALIAPFAFLGPQHDDSIKRFYTKTSRRDIFYYKPITAFFGGTALGDTAPLRRIIKEEVNNKLVAAIASESRRGRVLLIGTTNLDAQRPVVWDIGRIAESGHPEATQLIRHVMLASASIPGIFPPVIIDVVIDGERHQEVHVDGGVTNQIFVYPRTLDVRAMERAIGVAPKKAFWLIRNTKVEPEYKAVELGLRDIASRSISTLIKYQGRGDLLNISSLAKRDGFSVHLTNVPVDFDVPMNDRFDPVYMRALYKTGYETALSDAPWNTSVEGLLEAWIGKTLRKASWRPLLSR